MRNNTSDKTTARQQTPADAATCNSTTGSTLKVSRKVTSERIIMGIDPGTNILGYGILSVQERKVSMVAMGVIDLRKVNGTYLKLGRIYERVNSLIASFLPDELSIESPFFGKNAQSMLKLGRAQGVAIAAAINRDIPIHEYAPLKIKMSITGNGAASKQQVASMLQRYLGISDETLLPYYDATDALAAAYCHYLETSNRVADLGGQHTASTTNSEIAKLVHTGGTRNWKDFVTAHPERIK